MLFVFIIFRNIDTAAVFEQIYCNFVSSVVQPIALSLNDFRQPVDPHARRRIKLMAANKISASCRTNLKEIPRGNDGHSAKGGILAN